MDASTDGKPDWAAMQAFLLFAYVFMWVASPAAKAAQVEISGLVSYSNADFGGGFSSVERRYSGTVDFKFTAVSALEFEYTQSYSSYTSQSYLDGILVNPIKEIVSYNDTVYSLNWVQNLVSAKWILQPYFVIGGGRLIRHYSDSYPDVPFTTTMSQNVFTGTGGLGLRLFLTRNMAIKGEAKTYVPNFQFSKWKQDEALSVGLSWTF
jgi:hypothetical protein